jgi:hypothetical protein
LHNVAPQIQRIRPEMASFTAFRTSGRTVSGLM